ncbi:DNA gyrase inhibitor YacG [Sphaerotilus microaerophilus]|uniref:DNA gyrase inhibitor YacG n=1 Tax=Sphaerotilus microaerophilus TaxID=2914710 RepID=UPI0020738256|nr:DNA gyrase inhibitor YacG [Sphaerotilus sp. FB-5]
MTTDLTPGSRRPPPTVACPTCRRPSLFAPSNPWRPFCCERCRQIDFGAWAAGDYSVPADAPPDDDPRQPPPRGD